VLDEQYHLDILSMKIQVTTLPLDNLHIPFPIPKASLLFV
jgi:hypothetical protein